MPRSGGLAIYFSFLLGILIYQQNRLMLAAIIIGSIYIVIIITGIFGLIFELLLKVKIIGQLVWIC